MKVNAYFRWSFGLGFDAYRNDVLCLDIYVGPLTIEFEGGNGIDGLASGADPASGECAHSWSNWSALETVELPPSYSMFTVGDAPGAGVESTVQTRKCLKCNLHQRARIS